MLSVLFTDHVTRYPSPKRLTTSWALGSVLIGLVALQIITGLLLAMFFRASADTAFSDIVYIVNDVNSGYLFKYLHLNGASFIFAFMYMHMLRSFRYYTYFNLPKVWYTGMVIFLLMIITAFLGYVLPWGQMSFWAATVITNLVTTLPFIGDKLIVVIHGGFAVSPLTLNRFFVLHFLFAFVIIGVIGLHIFYLHRSGSSNKYHVARFSEDRVPFMHYFLFKDIYIFLAVFFGLLFVSLNYPNLLNHPDNFIEANPMVTPTHIVPEWYFLPFYAILRSVPSKLGGVFAMFFSIILLFALPILNNPRFLKRRFILKRSFKRYWRRTTLSLLLLGYLGAMPAASPYVAASQFAVFLFYYNFFRLIISKISLTIFDECVLVYWQIRMWGVTSDRFGPFHHEDHVHFPLIENAYGWSDWELEQFAIWYRLAISVQYSFHGGTTWSRDSKVPGYY